MENAWKGIRPGLGLLEIGRRWGAGPSLTPDDAGARAFLEAAFSMGVRIFDTAPSYAHSERRLGAFLKSLAPQDRRAVYVATKFGETWDFGRGLPVTSHSYDALMRSLERSLELLGRIDLIQIHKSTPEVLRSRAVLQAAQAARQAGVARIGASVKDLESARIACETPLFGQLQFPLNLQNRTMLGAVALARAAGRLVFVNRPFAEGALLAGGITVAGCLGFLAGCAFDGAVLMGTSDAAHLRSNLECFPLRPPAGAPPSA